MKRKILLTVLLYVFVIAVSFGLISCNKGALYERLETPQNLTADGRRLTWDEVQEAEGYTVFIDGKEYKTDKNELFLHFLDAGGKYDIEVMANGDGKTCLNSDRAEITVALSELKEHGFDSEGFEYILLKDDVGYEVSCGEADLVGDLIIPDYFEGLPVKKIANRGFASSGSWYSNIESCNTVTVSVTLPSRLEEIGGNAFQGMVMLKSIEIPDTVTTLRSWAFAANVRLERVKLPDRLKVIPTQCFMDTALSEISIPESVEIIESRAFACLRYPITSGGYRQINSDLSKIVIPETVKEIGDKAFYGRKKLNDITLPDNIEVLGGESFDDTAWYDSRPDGLVYLDDILYRYKGIMPENTKLKIPSSVKAIAGKAFYEQQNLTEIIIEDGVRLIGAHIFSMCKKMISVKLPYDLKTIPVGIFSLTRFNSILLPYGLEEIGYGAFWNARLEEIVIPESVKIIGDCAFYRSYLKRIKISNGVTTIGVEAFNDTKLTELVVPDSVKTIGHGAINNCVNLMAIVIPQEFENFDLVSVYDKSVYGKEDVIKPLEQFKIYYKGGPAELSELVATKKLRVSDNVMLYSYSETEPQEEGNFWHYVNGEIVVW